MQIDIEQLAKLGYNSQSDNQSIEWDRAPANTQAFYRAIAQKQQEFIQALINQQSNKVIQSLRNWVIFQLIPIIQPALTHKEKNEQLARLLQDLTKIKVVDSDEPDPDNIPFDLGAMSPENF
ncbi:hypothetical protein NIES4074_24180 [Cylindrospermum sp. NIES-4074]|nr:hypothetical protein NIES4074_24180 [Cylindrospermum sp. NIES-4074]